MDVVRLIYYLFQDAKNGCPVLWTAVLPLMFKICFTSTDFIYRFCIPLKTNGFNTYSAQAGL